MNIEKIDEYELSPDLEAEIAHVLAQCFDTDFGGRTYYQQRHHVRFICRDGDQLIGHLALCYRDVRLGDTLTPIWGLAEVATTPNARGQGVATALLHAAIAFAKTTPAQHFVLFGNRPMYEANGFVRHANIITFLTLEGAKTGGLKTGAHGGLMVLPLSNQQWDGEAHLDLLGHKF